MDQQFRQFCCGEIVHCLVGRHVLPTKLADHDRNMKLISQSEWQAMAKTHRQRARCWTEPARRRHAAGVPHPIEDFLFTYYPFSFSKLEQWHPGIGWALESDAASPLPHPYHRAPYQRHENQVIADPRTLNEKARARMVWTRELLDQTAKRSANFSCHGLHEWAMVYRGSRVRHQESTPLRLSQTEVDQLVESLPICCSHFDAVRFFHPQAIPLNHLQPSLLERPSFEQPACLHANMDLYKWAAKSMPWVGSELLLDCFELAMELRELDMRASPYDLSEYDLEPVCIENAEGRRKYEQIQRQLADRAALLRQQLLRQLDLTLILPPAGKFEDIEGWNIGDSGFSSTHAIRA